MLTPQDRAQATYNALSASGKLKGCNDAERAQVLAQLQLFLGADAAYLTSRAEIKPGTMAAQAGANVVTSGSPTSQSGSVTSNAPVIGEGVLF